MPSFYIHLAIASEYARKNNIIDKESLFKGTVEPDFSENKTISHYEVDNSRKNIDLKKYLNTNDINSEFNKGYFLHLYADYKFFSEYFKKEELSLIDEQKFLNDLYNSYESLQEDLLIKYNLEFYDFKDKIDEVTNNALTKVTSKEFVNVLPKENIYKFIDYISDVNIENVVKEILD